MLAGKRVLITGGAGFMGTALAKKLADQNEVMIYDNLHRNALRNTDLLHHPHVRFEQADVLDLGQLEKSIQGATHVVHLAAIAGVDTVLESPVRAMRVNILGTVNVLEVASRLHGLERLVDLSTSEVFGSRAYRVEETHVTSQGSVGEARWSYAVSKLASEYLAHSYFHEFGLPIVTVRPFNVYGPNQVGVGAVHQFIKKALRNEAVEIHGDGSQIRSWCYIDDVVDALLLVLVKPEAVGQVFNVGNPRSTVTILDLATRIIRLTAASSQAVFTPIGYADVEIRVPSVDKAKTLLGFDAQVDLDEGLRRTIAWYRSHS